MKEKLTWGSALLVTFLDLNAGDADVACFQESVSDPAVCPPPSTHEHCGTLKTTRTRDEWTGACRTVRASTWERRAAAETQVHGGRPGPPLLTVPGLRRQRGQGGAGADSVPLSDARPASGPPRGASHPPEAPSCLCRPEQKDPHLPHPSAPPP